MMFLGIAQGSNISTVKTWIQMDTTGSIDGKLIPNLGLFHRNHVESLIFALEIQSHHITIFAEHPDIAMPHSTWADSPSTFLRRKESFANNSGRRGNFGEITGNMFFFGTFYRGFNGI
jgi:hypothetical protein